MGASVEVGVGLSGSDLEGSSRRAVKPRGEGEERGRVRSHESEWQKDYHFESLGKRVPCYSPEMSLSFDAGVLHVRKKWQDGSLQTVGLACI